MHGYEIHNNKVYFADDWELVLSLFAWFIFGCAAAWSVEMITAEYHSYWANHQADEQEYVDAACATQIAEAGYEVLIDMGPTSKRKKRKRRKASKKKKKKRRYKPPVMPAGNTVNVMEVPVNNV